VTLAEALTGIAAVLCAVGGIILIVRELHRRERRSADRQIDTLSKQVHTLRADTMAYRSWGFKVARTMVDAGLEVPPPPEPTELAEPGDDTDLARPRWWQRRRS
jgi:hypothetical protein